MRRLALVIALLSPAASAHIDHPFHTDPIDYCRTVKDVNTLASGLLDYGYTRQQALEALTKSERITAVLSVETLQQAVGMADTTTARIDRETPRTEQQAKAHSIELDQDRTIERDRVFLSCFIALTK